MPSEFIQLLDPPSFVICDDVRAEIGGKFVLVGVYPGNVIIVRHFPHELRFWLWAVFLCNKEGTFDAQVRFKANDGTVGGMSRTTFTNSRVGGMTASRLACKLEVSGPHRFDAQFRFAGEEDWMTVGHFDVRDATQ